MDGIKIEELREAGEDDANRDRFHAAPSAYETASRWAKAREG